jgi:hypothetical protein
VVSEVEPPEAGVRGKQVISLSLLAGIGVAPFKANLSFDTPPLAGDEAQGKPLSLFLYGQTIAPTRTYARLGGAAKSRKMRDFATLAMTFYLMRLY